ncbi:hypothetical protein ACGGZK_14735 [Agromyces sp. MMS24-K17]|uniref:hypothetical protein n=1 Tax=Agromyces sp. MMS24-K17 TaxID=3372850 RepID=UPI003754843B
MSESSQCNLIADDVQIRLLISLHTDERSITPTRQQLTAWRRLSSADADVRIIEYLKRSVNVGAHA